MHIDHRLHQTVTLIESSDEILALGVNAWHLSSVAKSRNHTTRVTLYRRSLGKVMVSFVPMANQPTSLRYNSRLRTMEMNTNES
jgi:hypothetical protein